MNRANKLVTPNAEQSEGRWFTAVIGTGTVNFMALDQADADEKVKAYGDQAPEDKKEATPEEATPEDNEDIINKTKTN